MGDERKLSFGKKDAPAVVTDFANSRAYVIGVNAYSHGIPPLRTAVADAERLGQLLQESHGYQVRSFPRDGAATLATLRLLLRDRMPREVGPNDRVLFYFAGHGIALDGDDGPKGYLVPEDAKSDDRTSLLAMTELHDSLAKLPCRHLLLILDCCFAGAFRWSSMRDISALPSVIHRERFERYIHDPAWQVLTSAAHDQTALDVLSGNTIGERIESDAHSPFAAALFRALAGEADLIPRSKDSQPGGDGVITATELYLYLRECVESATVEHRTRQTPGLWPLKKHDKGEYILLTPGQTLNLPPAPLLDEKNNPYRGLQSYDEEHAAVFFGRSRFVSSLAERVKVQPLTIVLGASGTGKSSVVKAGLLPLLRSKEPNVWVILPPFRPGKYPLASLATLTLPSECNEPDAIDNRLRHLHSDPDALARRVGDWAAMAAPHARLVIVVDQFEELLTLCGDMGEREQFLRQIDRALTTFPDRVRILLTLRSDFEPQFANSPLQEEWLPARVVVPVMTLDEYREAIEGPASLKVLYLQGRSSSQAFIDRLIGDVANTPGALPLLSFTLSELYRRYLARRGDDRALLEEDYEALGGVGGSLRNRADEVYTGLPDDGHRATMRRVMLRMISVEGGELARRRVPDEELVYESPEENLRVQEVVRRLTDARLVVEGKETDGQPYIEPAHDELVRGWDKLLGWSREGQESQQLRRLLTPASSDWKQHRGGLWHANPRLNLVSRALGAEDLWLNRDEAEFVRASVARRSRIWVSTVSSVSAAFVILLAITVFAHVQRKKAVEETTRVMTNLGLQAEEQGRTLTALHHWAAAVAFASDNHSSRSPNRLRLSMRTQQMFQITAMLEHDSVRSASFDTSSSRLVTAGGNVVKIWDVVSQELIREIPHRDNVRYAEFSPDGKCVLTMGENVRIFNADSGDFELELASNPTYSTSYIDTGESILTRGEKTQIWNAKTGALLWENLPSQKPPAIASLGYEVSLNADNGQHISLQAIKSRNGIQLADKHSDTFASSAAVSPDMKYVALSRDREISVYSMHSGTLLRVLDSTGENVRFSPSGSYLIVIDSSQCHVVRTTDWSELRVLEGSSTGRLPGQKSFFDDILFVPNSSWMIAISSTSDSRIWDLESGMLVQSIEGQVGLTTAEVSDDGRSLATSEFEDNCVRLYRREVAGRAIRVDAPPDGNHVRLSPDGKSALSHVPGRGARLWTLEGETSLEVPGSRDCQMMPVYSPDGTRVAAGMEKNTVNIWTTKPLKLDRSEGLQSCPRLLSFSPDSTHLSVITEDGFAHVIRGKADSVLKMKLVEELVHCAVFDSKAERLAVSDNEKVKIWSFFDNSSLCLEHPSQVQDIAFINDGKELAVALFNSEVHLWDIGNRVRIGQLSGHWDTVVEVGEVPDSRDLFTRSIDASVRLWDRQRFKTRSLLQVASQSANGILGIAFSRDGRYIATGGKMNATVWDAETNQRVASFPCPADVTDIMFAADDQNLITLLNDQTIHIWNLKQLSVNASLAPVWTQAVTGTRINDAGEVEVLSTGEWISARRLVAP